MAAHVMKELINGMKLIVLSGKRRLGHAKRMRFFVAGALLNFVALFTLFVSTIYNQAIATTNTEIIMNSVVILFIADLDELLFDIYMALDISPEKNSSSEVLVNEKTTLQANMETMNEKMEGDMAELQMTMNQLLGIKTPPTVPQDEPAVHLKGGADASCLEKTVA